jgi:hypothetical protein
MLLDQLAEPDMGAVERLAVGRKDQNVSGEQAFQFAE